MPPPDPWPPDLASLGAQPPDRQAPIYFHERVTSTNDLALALAAAGAMAGTAVLADRQDAGRGRQGRSWWSPPGAGLYLSVVVRPADLGQRVPVLTLAAGVALASALRQVSGLPIELKWPNDVVIGRPWRKLAGILCEATGGASGAVVVGMGVNLQRSAYPEAIADRATSIGEECPREIGRDVIVRAVLAALDREVARLAGGQAHAVLDEWRRLAQTGLEQAPVRWRDQDGDHRGMAVGLDDTGALIVRRPGVTGDVRIVSGEVVWEMLTRE